MPFFPTDQWLEAYGRQLDKSDALDDLAEDWGDGFDGGILFVIEDLPLAETTLADLPDIVLEGIPSALCADIEDVTLSAAPDLFDESIRPTLPDVTRNLLEQIETNTVDGNVYAHVRLDGGTCTGVELLDDPDDRDSSFILRGSYGTWRGIVDGRPPLSAILAGALTVEGNSLSQVRYSAMLQLLGELAARVETVHLFEGEDVSLGDQLFDQSVSQSVFVQRTAQRQLSRTFSNL